MISLSVIVTVEVATPLATIGLVPEIVELMATAAPAVKRTVPSDLTTGVAIDKVLVSAFKEVSTQVEIPEALVDEHKP